MTSHTISVLVENEFGVLARVAGLFSGRGFNIESLTVNEDPLDPTVSRIVLVVIKTKKCYIPLLKITSIIFSLLRSN